MCTIDVNILVKANQGGRRHPMLEVWLGEAADWAVIKIARQARRAMVPVPIAVPPGKGGAKVPVALISILAPAWWISAQAYDESIFSPQVSEPAGRITEERVAPAGCQRMGRFRRWWRR